MKRLATSLALVACFTSAATLRAAPATEAPAGPASLAPLKEIGHVRATTTFCKRIIDRAVEAVERTIDDDTRIDGEVRTMRSADFDANALSKTRALAALIAFNSVLTEQTIAAERSAKSLREEAPNAPSPDVAKQLVAFADALAGAVHRQHAIARDVASMIAIFNQRAPMTSAERDELIVQTQRAEANRGSQTFESAEDSVPPLLSTIASDASDQIAVRHAAAVADERAAAELVEPVFGGC